MLRSVGMIRDDASADVGGCDVLFRFGKCEVYVRRHFRCTYLVPAGPKH